MFLKLQYPFIILILFTNLAIAQSNCNEPLKLKQWHFEFEQNLRIQKSYLGKTDFILKLRSDHPPKFSHIVSVHNIESTQRVNEAFASLTDLTPFNRLPHISDSFVNPKKPLSSIWSDKEIKQFEAYLQNPLLEKPYYYEFDYFNILPKLSQTFALKGRPHKFANISFNLAQAFKVLKAHVAARNTPEICIWFKDRAVQATSQIRLVPITQEHNLNQLFGSILFSVQEICGDIVFDGFIESLFKSENIMILLKTLMGNTEHETLFDPVHVLDRFQQNPDLMDKIFGLSTFIYDVVFNYAGRCSLTVEISDKTIAVIALSWLRSVLTIFPEADPRHAYVEEMYKRIEMVKRVKGTD